MPGKPAAEQGTARIRQRQVQAAPDQIVDEYGLAAYPQGFVHKGDELFWGKVMDKEARADKVEAAIGKGQGQCIRGHGAAAAPSSVVQVTGHTVEQSDLDGPAGLLHRGCCCLRHPTVARGHFQQGKWALAAVRNSVQHSASGRDSSKPPIDAFQVGKRCGNFGRGARISIKQFGLSHSLHGEGCGFYPTRTQRRYWSESDALRLQPVPLPAVACCKDRCSSHSERAVRRASRVLQSVRRVERQSRPHCGQWRRGAK